MKIFWAWQSDTPGKIGRHFIRKALQKALDELKSEMEIEEPERQELELDHDRKGVPGSPDLAATIFQKIDKSAVVVVDVTTVGRTDQDRALPNPNAMIELGYALARAGDQRLLMVANEAFSRREDLPFDLRHKAGPIFYDAPEGVPGPALEVAHKKLSRDLKEGLRLCLAEYRMALPPSGSSGFAAAKPQGTAAEYFKPGEILTPERTATPFKFATGNLAYLRFLPKAPMPRLRNADVRDLVYSGSVQPFTEEGASGTVWGLNPYGGLRIATPMDQNDHRIVASTQIFRSREIWGIDASMVVDEGDEGKILPMDCFERRLRSALRHYSEIGQGKLGLPCPIEVRGGISHAKGIRLHIPGLWPETWLGHPVQEDEIASRQELRSFETPEIDRVLCAILDDVFDAASVRRPEGFGGCP